MTIWTDRLRPTGQRLRDRSTALIGVAIVLAGTVGGLWGPIPPTGVVLLVGVDLGASIA